jgi:hypothetical protein
MMGRLNHDQGQFFYSFRLEEAVPDDHPVRGIAAVLDLSWVYSELEPFYPKIGRPSIDPVLMIRMLIIGYPRAIATRAETFVTLCQGVLFALQEAAQQVIGAQLRARGVPLRAIRDFDLFFLFAQIQIGDSRAQGRARLLGIERRARYPKAALVVVQPRLEVRYHHVLELAAGFEKMRQVAAPREVRNSFKAGRRQRLHVHQMS